MKALGVFHTRGKATTARPGAIWQTALHTTWITQGSSCLVWLVMGAVLSQTRIGGQCAPFGLGLVGAAGAGVGGLFSLMGVSLGAVAAMGLVDGLRIAAAAVLIYAVAFAVYDTRLYQARWLMPVATACLDGVTGMVYLLEGNWLTTEITAFGLEVALAGGAAWCFRRGLFPRGSRDKPTSDLTVLLREERVRDPVQIRCLLVLGAALLSGLSRYAIAELSPARILALTGVLILGAYRSPEAGVCVGVLFGLAVDLPQAGTPCCTVLYCLSGMAAGFLTKRRKPLCMLAAVGSAVLLSVTWQENAAVLPVEAFCSAAIFALLPRRLFRRLRAAENHLPTPQAAPAMAQVQEQLEAQASAFRSIYDHLQVALSEAPGESVSSMQLFARAADRVCVNCAKQNRCWRQEYGVTKTALTKCAPRLLERGRGVRSDFDRSFTDRCDHFPAFLTAVNQEVSNLLAQRQFQARVRENRAEVCRQYG